MTQSTNMFFDPKMNPFFDPEKNPFMNTDAKKFFAGFDAGKFDVEDFMGSQRKTFEAFAAANRTAAEGFQAAAKRQAEIVKAAMEDAAAAMKELDIATAPEEQVAKNAKLVKNGVSSAIANARELSELVAKSQAEAFEILNSRFCECLDEIESTASTAKSKKK